MKRTKRRMRRLMACLSCLLFLTGLLVPMSASARNQYRFSSPFLGTNPLNHVTREWNPTTNPNTDHRGIDIAWNGISGTNINAVRSGTVVASGWHDSWGYYVKIDHGDKLHTLYAHMISTPSVSYGASVSQGGVIGRVGNTGESYGAHLHFEVYLNGTRVNPRPYLTNCDLQIPTTTWDNYNRNLDQSYNESWTSIRKISYTISGTKELSAATVVAKKGAASDGARAYARVQATNGVAAQNTSTNIINNDCTAATGYVRQGLRASEVAHSGYNVNSTGGQYDRFDVRITHR